MYSLINELELASRSLETIIEYKIRDSELHKGQYAYILFLKENSGVSQLEISEGLLIDKTTVAKAIKKLELSGYIARDRNEDDKRSVKVYLTEKGEEAYELVAEAVSEVNSILYSGLDERDYKKLNHFLKNIRRNIEKEWIGIKSYIKSGDVRKGHAVDIISLMDLDKSFASSDLLDRAVSEERILVYELGDRILGYLQFTYDEPADYFELPWLLDDKPIILERLFVEDSNRRKGIASKLLISLEDRLLSEKDNYLKSHVKTNNIDMLRFFDSRGFKLVGEYKSDDSVNYCYEKILAKR